MIYDVCIIGGGASGLCAAIAAAREGACVLVIERMDKTGKKILATGNGRCNLTNSAIVRGEIAADVYRSRHRKFPIQVLAGFDAGQTLAFFESVALYTKDKGGYVYPMSEQAAAVCDALNWELSELKADIVTGTEVTGIQIMKNGSDKSRFLLKAEPQIFRSRRLIIAAGGPSDSALGSNGSGYQLCRQLGHTIVPVVPALCALHCKEKFFKELSGVRVQGKIQLMIDGRLSAADEGEIQLAAYGISGIPVFQVSRYAAYGLANHRNVEAVLDFLPNIDKAQLYGMLQFQIKQHPDRKVEMLLAGLMNKKLAACLPKIAKTDARMNGSKLQPKQLAMLVDTIKELHVQITETHGFEHSQVSAGGVDTKEIESGTLASKIVPGLYIVGELLDVDGICGGYNLQWAWATGILAGRDAGRKRHD
jgi:predicted Rossmann fold flavoprotein